MTNRTTNEFAHSSSNWLNGPAAPTFQELEPRATTTRPGHDGGGQ